MGLQRHNSFHQHGLDLRQFEQPFRGGTQGGDGAEVIGVVSPEGEGVALRPSLPACEVEDAVVAEGIGRVAAEGGVALVVAAPEQVCDFDCAGLGIAAASVPIQCFMATAD